MHVPVRPQVVRMRAATALARMAPEGELRSIFVERHGLGTLLDALGEGAGPGSKMATQRAAAAATLVLVRKISATAGDHECMPAQPPKTVYLGSQYVNNPTLADITFVVEVRCRAGPITVLKSCTGCKHGLFH